jgi:hypothetical protein
MERLQSLKKARLGKFLYLAINKYRIIINVFNMIVCCGNFPLTIHNGPILQRDQQ